MTLSFRPRISFVQKDWKLERFSGQFRYFEPRSSRRTKRRRRKTNRSSMPMLWWSWSLRAAVMAESVSHMNLQTFGPLLSTRHMETTDSIPYNSGHPSVRERASSEAPRNSAGSRRRKRLRRARGAGSADGYGHRRDSQPRDSGSGQHFCFFYLPASKV